MLPCYTIRVRVQPATIRINYVYNLLRYAIRVHVHNLINLNYSVSVNLNDTVHRVIHIYPTLFRTFRFVIELHLLACVEYLFQNKIRFPKASLLSLFTLEFGTYYRSGIISLKVIVIRQRMQIT